MLLREKGNGSQDAFVVILRKDSGGDVVGSVSFQYHFLRPVEGRGDRCVYKGRFQLAECAFAFGVLGKRLVFAGERDYRRDDLREVSDEASVEVTKWNRILDVG